MGQTEDINYNNEAKKRNSQKVNKILFSSDFIQLINKGDKNKAIHIYKEQQNLTFEESEKYIEDLESKSKDPNFNNNKRVSNKYAVFLIILILSIPILMFKKCTSSSRYKENNTEVETSRGYSTDPNYKPTMDDQGRYHTINGDARQQQYQGSQEQKRDLEEMDKRGW